MNTFQRTDKLDIHCHELWLNRLNILRNIKSKHCSVQRTDHKKMSRGGQIKVMYKKTYTFTYVTIMISKAKINSITLKVNS